MRVLQDPFLGPECRALFEEGDVDDRLLMMLLLTVERLRKGSLWKPYLDMLPTTFGNTLWFSEEELQELRGTTLYRATELQKKSLLNLYETKVKDLVKKLLNDGNSEIEVCFEDFLWYVLLVNLCMIMTSTKSVEVDMRLAFMLGQIQYFGAAL
ncbi:SET domain-containing protein [Trifolium pratense]|uniref:SET domain-containing protein n=1 Tax=Trifolium pratense TaxID=57577 RepID=A0A2K3LE32_TRIPR|nr:SET domain-containing protein [Trifolium pratense]